MKVSCPECGEPQDVVDQNNRPITDRGMQGSVAEHRTFRKTWSVPHANSFQTGVTVSFQCCGSNAFVVVDEKLDRRSTPNED